MRQALTRCYYSLNPLAAGGDGEDAEPLPTEPGAVQVLRPSCCVSEQFPLETGLVKIAARDRHGAPVSFETIPELSAVKFQAENPVGNHADFLPLPDVHLPLKRLAHTGDGKISRLLGPRSLDHLG